MELDDLKAAWAAHGALLERSLAIDERLLREVLLRKVRFALAPYVLLRILEVVLGLAALCLMVPVLVAHLAEPRYAIVGGALVVSVLGHCALTTHLVVAGLRLDFSRPVTTLQRGVQRLKFAEYRAFKWALLGGVLLWLPALLVLFEAVTGIDALARVGLPFLCGNLVVGLVVLAGGLLLSRRYVERPDLPPWARRVVDEVAGRSLVAAARHLQELASFEREEPATPPSSTGDGRS